MTDKPMRVLFLIAEAVPFAKTGGLADVGGALPKALHELGLDVRIAIPKYGRIDDGRFGLAKLLDLYPVPVDTHCEMASVKESSIGSGVPVYLVDSDKYFNREGIYGYPDDGERFVFFARAALEMLKLLGWQPDVIHCHDWHTGIVPNWLETIYRQDPFWDQTAWVFTIHNLQYQGVFGRRILEVAGIDEYGFLVHPEMADLDHVVDLMARGIRFADVVNTVSERYAQEIMTPEYGEKLDPLLRDRRDRVFGVLNGIDVELMNPVTDSYIAANFSAGSLGRRVENKLALQKEAHLNEDPGVPLIGIISRLVDQKGFDILGEVMDHLMDLGVQFVLLGTGDPHYHQMFTKVSRDYPGRCAIFLTFSAALAQKIYAGSDMFLMPSRFEPCGLGQMIAMRYGSVPIVRATGGLADTVTDWDPRAGQGNGFSFQLYDRWALFTAVVRALETYKYPKVWAELQLRGMKADFSWNASARRYIELYQKAREFHAHEHSTIHL